MPDSWNIYDQLIVRAQSEAFTADAEDAVNTDAEYTRVKQITIGLTWTLCQSESPQGNSIGLSMSPGQYTRTLPWSGTLADKPVNDLVPWLKSWNPFEAAIGLAAVNALINRKMSVADKATPVLSTTAPNLSVFNYFVPKMKNKKVVVIGRYPGLQQYESQLDLTVLERNPANADYPDPACEYLIPQADWVFITANSIANKTFPRLAELARDAVTVLMGPSVPWLEDWREYGVDFLAGVRITEPELLQATVAEGGGVRIFDKAVQYHVLDLTRDNIQDLKTNIAELVSTREKLKAEMDTWYAQSAVNKPGRFPKWALLEKTDQQLSLLDLRFKRQWDARFSV